MGKCFYTMQQDFPVGGIYAALVFETFPLKGKRTADCSELSPNGEIFLRQCLEFPPFI